MKNLVQFIKEELKRKVRTENIANTSRPIVNIAERDKITSNQEELPKALEKAYLLIVTP